MTAATRARPDPNTRARRLAYAAARILDLCDRLDDEHHKVSAAHRRGDVASAFMHRGIRDEYDLILARFHQQHVAELGRTAVDQALTVERRHRRQAAKAQETA